MNSVVLPLLLLLCLHAVAKENCSVTAKVRRDSRHLIHEAKSLKISCPVVHCGKKPIVKWCKISNGRVCTNVTETGHIQIEEGPSGNETKTSILEFVKISINDTGLYRCEASGELQFVSHSINVTVIAADDSRNSQSNETQTTTTSNYAEEARSTSLPWHVYIYIGAGILVLVIIVTVTVFILKSKKLPTTAKRTQDPAQRNLQTTVPLIKEDPLLPSVQGSQCPSLPDRSRSMRSHSPHRQRPPSIRSSGVSAPGPAPNHRSSRIQRRPATEAPPPRSSGTATSVTVDGAGIYDNDRDEAETPIVYAALNHQVAHKGQRRAHTNIPMDDLTEYAAIRVS